MNTYPTLEDLEAAKLAMVDIDAFTYSESDTFNDANSVTRTTITGALKKLGYLPPIVYASGIDFTTLDNTKTIEVDSVIYAPHPTLLPFTTSGTFTGDDDSRFYVVQLNLSDLNPDTVAVMTANTLLRAGDWIETKGYYVVGGGGNAKYLIKTVAQAATDGDVIDEYANHSITGGLYVAILQTGLYVNIKQCGAQGNGVDDTASFAAAKALRATIFIPESDSGYLVDGVIRTADVAGYETNTGLENNLSPFYLIWSGQSNALGAAEVPAGYNGTSNEVEDGVFIWNYSTAAWIKPVWGTTPLPTGGSNNAGVRCANEIKRKTGRDVYLIVNGFNGNSIANWVSSGASSTNFVDLTTQIADSELPRIDGFGWMQGEADSDGSNTAYNTTATYRSGLNLLIAQLKALPQWQEGAKFIASGVGEWYDLKSYERNDVLLSLDNLADKSIGNISTTDTARNPNTGQSSHFSHASLTLIGVRIAAKILKWDSQVSVYAGKGLKNDGATLPRYGTFSGTTTTGTAAATIAIVSGAATSLGSTTTFIDTSRIGDGDDIYNEQVIRFTKAGSAIENEYSIVRDFVSSTGEFTLYTPATSAIPNADTYDIEPMSLIDASRTEADDTWNDFIIRFTNPESEIYGEYALVVGFDATTKSLIFDTPTSMSITSTDTYALTTTELVDPMYLKGGAYFHCSNYDFYMPDPVRYDGALIVVNVTTAIANQPVLIHAFYRSKRFNIKFQTSIVYQNRTLTSVKCDSAGQWVFRSMNGSLYLVSKPIVQSIVNEKTVDGITRDIDVVETVDSSWRVHNATLNLPEPTALTNASLSVICYSTAGGTSTIGITGGATGKFLDESKAIVDTLPLLSTSRSYRLRSMNSRWVVESLIF